MKSSISIMQYMHNYINIEDLTLSFSKEVNYYCKQLKVTIYNRDYISQLLRSSSSIGANYREANNHLGKKDEILRLKIARKEAKETIYWLELIEINAEHVLLQKAYQLMKILSSIISKKEKQ